MKEKTIDVILGGKKSKLDVIFFEPKDKRYLRSLFNSWKKVAHGMKKLKARAITLPEGLSEVSFCLNFANTVRVIRVRRGKGSFDAVDLKRRKRIQIKATSIDRDLTSFGPDSIWDEIYWLDFYRGGKLDGSFDVYKIPNSLIYKFKVNANQTFIDQQKQGRRPRLGIRYALIKPRGIKPIRTCMI